MDNNGKNIYYCQFSKYIFSDAVCILKCLKSIRRHTCIYVQYLSVTNEVLSDPDAQMCREEKQH